MIEARGLTKRYGDKVAVDGLTFTVRPGVVTGFLGPERRRQVHDDADDPRAGPRRPPGSVTVNGRPYADLAAPLREVGALLEARAVHTGRGGLQPPAVPWPPPTASRARRVDEVIDLVGLADVARKRAGGFSLGMGQRLGIAAALLGDPPTVMLDEPVNGLDPEGIRWVRDLLQGPGRRGPDGLRLQPPDERDGADRRAPHRHRPRPADRRHHGRGVHPRRVGRRRRSCAAPTPPRCARLLPAPTSTVSSDEADVLHVTRAERRPDRRHRPRRRHRPARAHAAARLPGRSVHDDDRATTSSTTAISPPRRRSWKESGHEHADRRRPPDPCSTG